MKKFYYPHKPDSIELKIKSSLFKAYIYHINSMNDFKESLLEIKNKYNNATHICYAYRLCNDNYDLFDTPIIDDYFIDAGEPSGTAGKPILNMLIHYRMINTVIFVVRYYGGIKLGIPGLIDAYKRSAQTVLKNAHLTIWKNNIVVKLSYDYNTENLVKSFISKYECLIIESSFSEIIHTKIELDKSDKENFILELNEKSNGTIRFDE